MAGLMDNYLYGGQQAQPQQSGVSPELLASWGIKQPEPFAPGALGDNAMDFKTKLGLGLGMAQTGLNAYLGFQGNKLAKRQYNESKRQFNTNMSMQQGSMRGQLTDRYNTASDPSKLGSSAADYMSRYGL